jgi:hypothetical protein
MLMVIGWAVIITIIFIIGMMEMRENRENERKRINYFIETHKCVHHGKREENQKTEGK